MKKIIMAVSLLVFAVFLVSCAPSKGNDPVSIIKANMKAFQEKNVDNYMATISPKTPGYESTGKMMAQLFQVYDFKVELKDLKVVSQDTMEAKVTFTQIMKKVKGPDFKDNQIEGIHTLINSDSGWQIYNTEIKAIKYL
jgi:hypothetical protein